MTFRAIVELPNGKKYHVSNNSGEQNLMAYLTGLTRGIRDRYEDRDKRLNRLEEVFSQKADREKSKISEKEKDLGIIVSEDEDGKQFDTHIQITKNIQII